MKRRKFKRLAIKSLEIKPEKEGMTEPSLIDITNDNELMDRVLKKSAEMQEETLKKAEGKE
jgi:hypothetical protein